MKFGILKIILLLQIILTINCIEFDLPIYEERCFTEEVPSHFEAFIDYETIDDTREKDHTLRVNLFNPDDRLIHTNQKALRKAEFHFNTADIGGTYKLCFFNQANKGKHNL
jgi:hypothetical protein